MSIMTKTINNIEPYNTTVRAHIWSLQIHRSSDIYCHISMSTTELPMAILHITENKQGIFT